jgi:hypothetical protein
VGGLRQIGSAPSRDRMVETIQLAGDECAVAQFGVTPSERMRHVPNRPWDCDFRNGS